MVDKINVNNDNNIIPIVTFITQTQQKKIKIKNIDIKNNAIHDRLIL